MSVLFNMWPDYLAIWQEQLCQQWSRNDKEGGPPAAHGIVGKRPVSMLLEHYLFSSQITIKILISYVY